MSEMKCTAEMAEKLLKFLKGRSCQYTTMDMAHFTQLMHDAGMDTDTDTLRTWFTNLDSNGDGMVGWDEFFPVFVCVPMFEKCANVFEKIEWTNEEYGCHHMNMDREHHSFVNMINEMCVPAKCGKMEMIGTVMTELKNYSDVHFPNEIQMLRDACYDKADPAAFAAIEKEHKTFIDHMTMYDVICHDGDVATMYEMMMCDMMPFIREWGGNHIKKSMKGACEGMNMNVDMLMM